MNKEDQIKLSEILKEIVKDFEIKSLVVIGRSNNNYNHIFDIKLGDTVDLMGLVEYTKINLRVDLIKTLDKKEPRHEIDQSVGKQYP